MGMFVEVSQEDIDLALQMRQKEGGTADNPVVRAVMRAVKGAGASVEPSGVAWSVTKMPFFDADSYRTGASMPQLYVLNDGDVFNLNYYVLPLAVQVFLQHWYAGESVRPLRFELEHSADVSVQNGHVYGLPRPMIEGIREVLHSWSEAGNQEVDLGRLKEGFAQLMQEANREIDLDPIKRGIEKLAGTAGTYGRMPVADIARSLIRPERSPSGDD
jgi:hypothetical protein